MYFPIYLSFLLLLFSVFSSFSLFRSGVSICRASESEVSVRVLAGSQWDGVSRDGVGTNGWFYHPTGIAYSPDGTYALIVDSWSNLIRKIIVSTYEVTTVAGTIDYGSTNGIGTNALFSNPTEISIPMSGEYAVIADPANNQIRKLIITTADVSLVAGDGDTYYGTNNGVGTNAGFFSPEGVAISSDGNLVLVADRYNNQIRQINMTTATVDVLAGALSSGYANGFGTNALFRSPRAVSISPNSIYALVADTANQRIRKIIISTLEVSVLAGESMGLANGFGTNAMFRLPISLSISRNGNFSLVADYTNSRIRRIEITTGEVTDLVGGSEIPQLEGIGTNAYVYAPSSVDISPNGASALITDSTTNQILQVNILSTFTSVVAGVVTNANGVGTNALFFNPYGVSISSDGKYALTVDSANSEIRKIILSTALVSRLAGSISGFLDGIGTNAKFSGPRGVALTKDYAFVADTYNDVIRKIVLTTDVVSVYAGSSSGAGDGIGTNAQFNRPTGITISPDETYALIPDSYNNRVRKIDLSVALVSVFVGRAAYGRTNGIGTNAQFSGPQGVALSSDGSFALVTDGYNYLVRKIEITTAFVSVLAGSTSGNVNGIGTNAKFSFLRGVAISADGSYALVTDSWNYGIRKIEISTALVTLLTGNSYPATNDGIGTNAYFNNPSGVTISPNGRFALIADTNNNMIRKIEGLQVPSWLRVADITCPQYYTSDTYFAQQNFITCSFQLCPEEYVEISYCSNCVTDNYLRLYNSKGTEVLSGLSSCGSCVPFVYDYSNHVSCEAFTIHQGCNLDDTCSGEGSLNINRNYIEDVKYEIAVIFNASSIIPLDKSLLVQYISDGKGQAFPFVLYVHRSEVLTDTDELPSQDWMLVKWRPVVMNTRNSNQTIGSWNGFRYLPARAFKSLLVSDRTQNVVGFILSDPHVSGYRVYFFQDDPSVQRRLSQRQLTSSDTGTPLISLQHNISIDNLKEYVTGISDQFVYLLDSTYQPTGGSFP